MRDGQGVAAIREGFQSADDQSGESLCVVLPLEDGGAGIVVEHDVRPAAFRVFEAKKFSLLLSLIDQRRKGEGNQLPFFRRFVIDFRYHKVVSGLLTV